ncbi:hypothetical protein KFK09_025374 [Dendrobium nobile]|uniref:Uncharacterized protein n=1 Tax=Dendrobium nobile TaxID=94219 RepID=A0A8T3AGN7_DENNO|nr:hypothetical protein KFK09_025374 [Dendrobium nobile]
MLLVSIVPKAIIISPPAFSPSSMLSFTVTSIHVTKHYLSYANVKLFQYHTHSNAILNDVSFWAVSYIYF